MVKRLLNWMRVTFRDIELRDNLTETPYAPLEISQDNEGYRVDIHKNPLASLETPNETDRGTQVITTKSLSTRFILRTLQEVGSITKQSLYMKAREAGLDTSSSLFGRALMDLADSGLIEITISVVMSNVISDPSSGSTSQPKKNKNLPKNVINSLYDIPDVSVTEDAKIYLYRNLSLAPPTLDVVAHIRTMRSCPIILRTSSTKSLSEDYLLILLQGNDRLLDFVNVLVTGYWTSFPTDFQSCVRLDVEVIDT